MTFTESRQALIHDASRIFCGALACPVKNLEDRCGILDSNKWRAVELGESCLPCRCHFRRYLETQIRIVYKGWQYGAVPYIQTEEYGHLVATDPQIRLIIWRWHLIRHPQRGLPDNCGDAGQHQACVIAPSAAKKGRAGCGLHTTKLNLRLKVTLSFMSGFCWCQKVILYFVNIAWKSQCCHFWPALWWGSQNDTRTHVGGIGEVSMSCAACLLSCPSC